MDQPGAPIEEVFKAMRAAVRRESRNAQIPWESTSLESEFAFRAAPRPPPPAQGGGGRGEARGRPALSAAPRRLSVGAPPALRGRRQLDLPRR